MKSCTLCLYIISNGRWGIFVYLGNTDNIFFPLIPSFFMEVTIEYSEKILLGYTGAQVCVYVTLPTKFASCDFR